MIWIWALKYEYWLTFFFTLKADDVISKMSEVLREGYTENLDEFSGFVEKEENEFKPVGELLHNFSTNFKVRQDDKGQKARKNTNGVSSNGHGDIGAERCFEIYLVDVVSSPKFIEYLKRMETFVLFFIDAATFVPIEDDKWRFFTM